MEAPEEPLMQALCGERDEPGFAEPGGAPGPLPQAMNLLGARSNTGEGGEDPAVYRPVEVEGFRTPSGGSGEMSAAYAGDAGATAVAEIVAAPAVHVSLNNKIKQVASGAVWRDGRVPGACRGDRDQGGAGRQAWRGRAAAGAQGHRADRAAAACAAGGEPDFAAAAP